MMNHKKPRAIKKKSIRHRQTKKKRFTITNERLIRILLVILLIALCGGVVKSCIKRMHYGHVTMKEVQACENKQAYLDLVVPIYKMYCKEFHIKYPEVLALQVFYEVGSSFPKQLSTVAKEDNNLGGLKYTKGVPNASQGQPCPANEGGYYCHFDNVSDYIYAQCWQIGQPLYKNVRKHQSSVEDFTRALCNLWIGGEEGTEPFGYSEDLIADYKKYVK